MTSRDGYNYVIASADRSPEGSSRQLERQQKRNSGEISPTWVSQEGAAGVPRPHSSLDDVTRMSSVSAPLSSHSTTDLLSHPLPFRPTLKTRRSGSMASASSLTSPGSLTSPPPPPADFNPPADFSSDLPLHGISKPLTQFFPTSPVPSSSSDYSTIHASTGTAVPGPPSFMSALEIDGPDAFNVPSSESLPSSQHLPRPQSRSVRQVSSESVGRAQHSATPNHNGANSTSDGGGVLAQARDELVCTIRSAEDEWARRSGSSAASSPTLDTAESNSNPMASSSTSSFMGSTDELVDVIPSRPRSYSNRASSDETVHAWDSVWPAPNVTRRNISIPNYDPNQPGPSRFPTAPVSPYVTPSFSPAIVQAQTPAVRAFSTSPPIHDSFLERPGGVSSPGHRASLPMAVAPRHSSSRYSLRSEDLFQSPPQSPVPPSSTTWGSDLQRPGSPFGSGGGAGTLRSRPITYAPSSPGSNRTPIPGSPPLFSRIASPGPSRQPRRDRASSFVSQFPELVPPFISRRELAKSQSRLTRRLSETAIVRRPDDSLLLAGQVSPSSITTHNEPHQVLDDMNSSDNRFSPSLSPVRPGMPRRVKSAQDTHGGTRSIHPALPLTLAPGLHLTSLDGTRPPDEPSDDIVPPASRAFTRPDNLFVNSSVFDMDDHAIDDEEDDDDEIEDVGQEPRSLSELSLQTSPVASARTDEERPMLSPLGFPCSGIPSQIALVDEGDVLPTDTAALEMDVTFDDEGLNTLERIFLLSRSEYAFHRAYVARVLGDLLGDVDPCESVEYVLPLISAFSLDEDETVKEAFATDLHRILWYFFTTCQLLSEEEEGTSSQASFMEVGEPAIRHTSPLPESVRRLENMHPTQPMDIDILCDGRTQSGDTSDSQGVSSSRESHHSTYGLTGFTVPGAGDYTPMTSVTTSSSADAVKCFGGVEGQTIGNFRASESHDTEATPEVVSPPVLHVGFFRPLLGTMLLSHNPQVANPTRDGIIKLISRLRGHGASVESWGASAESENESQTYLSQTGPHYHQAMPFDEDARGLVEQELLYGIVLGMGTLSTDVPDSLFNDTTEVIGDDGEVIDQDHEAEMYRLQMIHEATLGRALSLSFIGSLSELYSPEEVLLYGFIDEVIRGQDGNESTRAEAALAIGKVVRASPPDDIDRLIEVFESFACDSSPLVLQSACSSLSALCRRITSNERRREFAVKIMEGFMSSDNENVHYAALEALGEVIYSFAKDPLGPPHQLLEIYCKDKETCRTNPFSTDCDWEFLASFNFPGVCLTLGPERWSEIRGLYQRLVHRVDGRARRTIAASLHELAQILYPEQIVEDILPAYQLCLTFEDSIRECIFEHVDVLIARLPQVQGWECFLDLSRSWENNTLGGWRAREQLALHIPSFLETFHQHSEVAAVLGMMRSALLDPFAAVRDAVTCAVPRAYEILGRSKCSQEVLHDMLLTLGFSSSYRQRLTFVRCLREFIRPPPNRDAFEKFFMPSLLRLSEDIVDVRLGLAKAIADLFVVGAFYGDRSLSVPMEVRRLASVLADDDSCDVRNVIQTIGADRWAVQSSELSIVQEMAETDNPQSVETAIEDVMEDSSPSRAVVKQKKGLHERALLPSPLIPDQFVEDPALNSEPDPDPFAASFGRAASVSSQDADSRR